MENKPFLTIDNQSITLAQALAYLRATGDLQPFLLKIIRQHLLETELQTRDDLEIDSTIIEQAVIDFRLENQLTNPDRFQEWLKTQGISYAEFRYQIAATLKIEKLKVEVTAPELEKYFNDNKALLVQVVLSRIVVADKDFALSLKNQILEESSRFELLAREHSLTDDRLLNGMMGVVPLGQIPEQLQEFVATAKPGELIGPLEIDGRYALLCVHQFLPACLEGQLKRELQDQIFDQWLQEKAQKLTIKMHVE
ncbi:peptidylprolyl isomerase [Limnofasciculus baicalensis]|uniref:peptidylprolyl isomerase n=1 Tax=Limnofasciculus baicalensis BBK-W-15 TaxID=2699891 RepID=A0AAE3KN82_9CYAN|nr:peptidylprolyl isomerase [Limnofasciculus baicalensis]MCP2730064.1 peptidylprolyl isomerase [Limnofasciculus baicalensis BBK-W-15]